MTRDRMLRPRWLVWLVARLECRDRRLPRLGDARRSRPARAECRAGEPTRPARSSSTAWSRHGSRRWACRRRRPWRSGSASPRAERAELAERADELEAGGDPVAAGVAIAIIVAMFVILALELIGRRVISRPATGAEP